MTPSSLFSWAFLPCPLDCRPASYISCILYAPPCSHYRVLLIQIFVELCLQKIFLTGQKGATYAKTHITKLNYSLGHDRSLPSPRNVTLPQPICFPLVWLLVPAPFCLYRPFIFCNSLESFPSARRDTDQFMTHWTKPIGSLNFFQLSF